MAQAGVPGTDPNYARTILQGLAPQGVKVTPQNLRAVTAWQGAEGGTATNNPLNTTQPESGTSNYNSVGVKNYGTWKQGLQATLTTLKNGNYPQVLDALKQGNNAGAVADAVGHSPWGTSGALMSQILHSPYTAPGPQAKNMLTAVKSSASAEDVAAAHEQNLTTVTADTGKAIIDWALNNSRNLQTGEVGTSISGLTDGILAGIQAAQPINQIAPTKSLPHDPTLLTASGQAGTKLDQKALAVAKEYLGTPYKWAGAQPGGFDCSGLLQYVWGKEGVSIPRTTYDQFKAGQSVSKGALRPGDAVFFTGSDPLNGLPGHVGMYIGGGKMIVAPHTGSTVQIQNVSDHSDYVGARRYA